MPNPPSPIISFIKYESLTFLLEFTLTNIVYFIFHYLELVFIYSYFTSVSDTPLEKSFYFYIHVSFYSILSTTKSTSKSITFVKYSFKNYYDVSFGRMDVVFYSKFLVEKHRGNDLQQPIYNIYIKYS